MENLTLYMAEHNGQQLIFLKFRYSRVLKDLAKQLPDALWSSTHKAFSTPYSIAVLKQIKALFEPVIKIDAELLKQQVAALKNATPVIKSQSTAIKDGPPNIKDYVLSEEAKIKIEKFKCWAQSRRYSESTIGTYCEALKTFFKFYSEKGISEITNDDVIQFNNKYILANNFSASFQNQVVNAIKLFFIKIEIKAIEVEIIHRPKRAKVLPNVLSKEEVKLILNAHNNLKHKAMLSLIYSCGLRCGELLKLKPEHIDSKRNVVIIKQAKGKKDRIAPLSLKIVEMLREYFRAVKPVNYLFEGKIKGEPYDARSLQQVLKQSLEKANITKPVSLHWLRHSYATHLLESGTDIRYIQEILGHSSSKTTEIYTHVSTKSIQHITSPFDYL